MAQKPTNRDGSTHGRKPADWSDPHQAPPNVVTLVSTKFDSDLNDIEKWLQKALPWSVEKTHYLFLLSQIVQNKNVPLKSRKRACSVMAEYSDTRVVADKFLGAEIAEKIKKQIGE